MAVKVLEQEEKDPCALKVKLKAGANIVKTRPLFSHDSKYIILASGCDIKIFNVKSGECTQTLTHHESQVISLEQNKQNPLQIISCSEDGIIIRWDLTDGKILQVCNCGMQVACFFAPSAEGPWFVVKKYEDHYRLYAMNAKGKQTTNVHMILRPVLPNKKGTAFSSDNKFVAAIFDCSLTIYEVKTKLLVRHLTGHHNLTCVAFHPSEPIVATGDSSGRTLIWSNILNSKNPVKSIYHWHSLPVADLIFSVEGSHLYSGGGEAALVKWNLFSNKFFVVPRLGAPICSLAISPDSNFVLTAHEDNGLQVINAQRVVVQCIQGLTKGYFKGSHTQNSVPTGMFYDPGTKALVMNGRPGHLQFYNIQEDKQLFNLDITSRNFVSKERHSEVYNIDVQKAAVDDSGSWLSTVEYWDDAKTSPQIWLKFWMFDSSKNNFILNTNVILPHEKDINCIVFRPTINESYSLPLAVTCSNDCKFKIWSYKAKNETKLSWSCDAMGCYRDFPSKDACFSEEGSVLAIAFSGVATLWTVDKMALKEVLCCNKTNRDIIQLMFGKQSCSHYLVCHDGSLITVWNVLTLTITWLVHVEVQTLALDPVSGVIAAFTNDQNLFIFKPNSPYPLYSSEKTAKKAILSAVFVPLSNDNDADSSCFHKKSQLFFLDSDQNLFTLTDEPDTKLEWQWKTDKKITITQSIPKTPFDVLQAEQKISDVKVLKPDQLILDNQISSKDDFDITCPTLMDPLALCSAILPTLLIPNQTSSKCLEKKIKPKELSSDNSLIPNENKSVQKTPFFDDFSFLMNLKL